MSSRYVFDKTSGSFGCSKSPLRLQNHPPAYEQIGKMKTARGSKKENQDLRKSGGIIPRSPLVRGATTDEMRKVNIKKNMPKFTGITIPKSIHPGGLGASNSTLSMTKST
jgi:hypothetical protein